MQAQIEGTHSGEGGWAVRKKVPVGSGEWSGVVVGCGVTVAAVRTPPGPIASVGRSAWGVARATVAT